MQDVASQLPFRPDLAMDVRVRTGVQSEQEQHPTLENYSKDDLAIIELHAHSSSDSFLNLSSASLASS